MLVRTLEPEVMDSPEEADEYDCMDHAAVNQAFVDDCLAHMAAAGARSADALVLDLGTGTARIPIAMCRAWPACRIVAIDMAVAMLQLARRNVTAAGLDRRIVLPRAQAIGLPAADRSFDLSISNSLIHHLPQPARALDEMCRVTRAGGFVFVRDLVRPATAADVDALVQQYAAQENRTQQQLLAASLHASLTLDEVRAIARQLPLERASVAATSDRHWTLAGIRRA